MTMLREGHRKARKQHQCNGWQYLEEASFDITEMKRCVGINKEDEYYFQVNVLSKYDGIQTFKSCRQCMDEGKRFNLPIYDDY